MKKLVVLLPLIGFSVWMGIEKPKGGIILVAFFLVVICIIGLAETLGLKEIDPEERNNGDS